MIGFGLALAPGAGRASGFHIDEQDARATGRAGAVLASPKNATTVYYNPAGIATLRGVHASIGGAVVRPHAEFTSADDDTITALNEHDIVLPQAFISWRLGEVVALGIGAYAPFGLALDWPASSPGRTNIRKVDLRTLYISPALGINLSPWLPGLSLGAGVDLVPANVRLDRDILFGSDVGSVALDGSAFGLGASVGVLFRPPALPAFAVGFSCRSRVALHFSGDADFDAPLSYRTSLPPDGPVETSFVLPLALGAGFQLSPLPELELELDVNWRGWSAYDQVEAELPDGSVDLQRKDWKNSLSLRLGGEYTFAERWSVRAGGVLEQTPVPSNRLDFQVPDVNRTDVSFGLGARVTDRVRIDLGAIYVLPRKRLTSTTTPLEPPAKGRFEVDVLLVALSVGVQLGTMTPAPDAGRESVALLAGAQGAPRAGRMPLPKPGVNRAVKP